MVPFAVLNTLWCGIDVTQKNVASESVVPSVIKYTRTHIEKQHDQGAIPKTHTSLEALQLSASPHLPCHLISLRHYKEGAVLAIPCIKSTYRQSKIVLRNINNILSA